MQILVCLKNLSKATFSAGSPARVDSACVYLCIVYEATTVQKSI